MLFEQILRSEQKAENRRSELSQVNKDILKNEKEIQDLHKRIETCKQKIESEDSVVLYQAQTDIEVLKMQSELLEQQRSKLRSNIDQLKRSYEETNEKNDQGFDKLLDEIDTFINTYGLNHTDCDYLKNQHLNELKKLKEDEKKALINLEKIRKQREERTSIAAQLAALSADLSHLRERIIDLDSNLDRKCRCVRDQNAEIEAITASALTDPEYCRLQEELQSLDNNAFENEVVRLRNELRELKKRKK